MKRGTKFYLALSFIFLGFGIFFILNSVKGITGNAILEEYDSEDSTILGIVLLFGGVLLMMQAAAGIKRELKEPGILETKIMDIGTFFEDYGFPKTSKIVFDSDWLKEYSKDNASEKHKLLDKMRHRPSLEKYSADDLNVPIRIDFGDYNFVLPGEVKSEVLRKSEKTSQPLVPRTIINYLTGYLGVDDTDVNPTAQEIEKIREICGEDVHKGEMAALVYALRREKNPTIILSNDHAVHKSIEKMIKTGKVNVIAMRYEDFKKAKIEEGEYTQRKSYVKAF